VSATSLAIMAVMYVLTAVGVDVGYHRILTHRSCQVSKPPRVHVRGTRLNGGRGPVMSWVAEHASTCAARCEEGDPPSQNVGHGDGETGLFCDARLGSAHGGLFSTQGQAKRSPLREDLYEDPGMLAHQPRFRSWLCSVSTCLRWPAGPITGNRSPAPRRLLFWGGARPHLPRAYIKWSVNRSATSSETRRFHGPTTTRPKSHGA